MVTRAGWTRPGWVGAAVGLGGAVVAMAPWWAAGARLPIQNLWADASATAQMPVALLPLSQYEVVPIAALLLVGAGLAGLVARLLHARTLPVVGGLLLGQVVAAVQSFIVLAGGLEQSRLASVYLGVLVALVIVCLLVGVGIVVLAVRAPAAGRTVGLALAAVFTASWLGVLFGVIAPIDPGATVEDYGRQEILGEIARFAPAVLVGASLAWCGVRSAGRKAAWAGSLLLLWFGSSALIAVGAAAGTRVYATLPLEMAEYAGQVFRSALLDPALVLPLLAAAVATALLGLLIRRLTPARSSR